MFCYLIIFQNQEKSNFWVFTSGNEANKEIGDQGRKAPAL